jgi:hypothetical protein
LNLKAAKTLKPGWVGFHLLCSIVEAIALSSYGATEFNLYSPAANFSWRMRTAPAAL